MILVALLNHKQKIFKTIEGDIERPLKCTVVAFGAHQLETFIYNGGPEELSSSFGGCAAFLYPWTL